MTEWGNYDTSAARDTLGERTGNTVDPLAEHVETMDGLDGLNMYYTDVLVPKGLKENTLETYRSSFNTWVKFMHNEGRRPELPSKQHVHLFIEDERDAGNSDTTIKDKLKDLDRAFRWWAADTQFPHTADHNPFALALEETAWNGRNKEQYRTTVEELREAVASITNVRDRLMVLLGLKLGLRGGEVRNIQIRDISLTNPDVLDHYDEMGSSRQLSGRENAIYIPPSWERDGNKSKRPRVLPLDQEMRQAIIEYLLIRPDAESEPWLLLSQGRHGKIKDTKDVSRAWEVAFPEHRGTDEIKAIESHYGRHRFSTRMRIERDVPRELVKYMRGDKSAAMAFGGETLDAIDAYLHTYYEDIEEVYKAHIYQLVVE